MPLPLLADSTDLSDWANRRDAQDTLPKLVRNLILNTVPGIEQIDFRADEGVQLAGYDGVVRVETGNAYVPDGRSVWELGTSDDPKAKATGDFNKRSEDPGDIEPLDTVFVFVTPRRWAGKGDWINARKEEAKWLDVRAYDADDLATWLEQAPAVHIWLSGLLGKRPPSGTVELESLWKEWTGVTVPPLNAAVVTAGRNEAAARIREWSTGTPSVLSLQAESPLEAAAFLWASTESLPRNDRQMIRSGAVAVGSLTDWRQLTAASNQMTLIPLFAERDRAVAAIGGNHHVLVPLGRDDSPSTETVVVPRPRIDALEAALVGAGFGEERARELARLGRHSSLVLRRNAASDRSLVTPEWTRAGDLRPVLGALLAGGWDNADPDDRSVLEGLCGKPYEEMLEAWEALASQPDPPIRRTGNIWSVLTREDVWYLVSRRLTEPMLARFATSAKDVISLTDPALDLPREQRWMAGILGKKRIHSGYLRSGLADGLALMGAQGDQPLGDGTSAQVRADRIVWEILDSAATPDEWRSLAPHLTSFSEAAPGTTLDYFERGTEGGNPTLLALFEDKDDDAFNSNSGHTHLLWALEQLAWSPDYLARSALLLARLARLDPGGRLGNRPIRSLRDVFLCWRPHTAASLEKRARVLGRLAEREPDVAWHLLLELLPKTSDSTSPTSKPKWRDWASDSRRNVTLGEAATAVTAFVDGLVRLAGNDPVRWASLAGHVAGLPSDQFDRIIGGLSGLDAGAMESAARTQLWLALKHLISHHMRFPEADWSMSKERLDAVRPLHGRFTPTEPLERDQWVFAPSPPIFLSEGRDWEARENAVAAERVAAAKRLVEQGGVALLLQAANDESAFTVGVAAARIGFVAGEEEEFLDASLGSSDPALRNAALAYLQSRSPHEGEDWPRDLLGSSLCEGKENAKRRVDVCLCLPCVPETWDLVDSMGEEEAAEYWRSANPFRISELDLNGRERLVFKLADAGRVGDSIHIIGVFEKGGVLPVGAPAALAMIDRALADGLDAGAWANVSHDIASILDALEAHPETKEHLPRLELALLPILEHGGRRPKTLERGLSEDPEFFSAVLGWVYKGEGEATDDEVPEEEQRARYRVGSELLDGWRTPPGLNEDGTVDPDRLKTWVSRVRALAVEQGRADPADSKIGEVLRFLPAGEDGIWPPVALREIIEDSASDRLDNGIRSSVYNSRGVTMRMPYDGGEQERSLAERYRKYEDAVRDEWPRTSRILARIAERYEAQAAEEDRNAELQQDMGR